MPIELDPEEAARLKPYEVITRPDGGKAVRGVTGAGGLRRTHPQVIRREALHALADAVETQAKIARGESFLVATGSRDADGTPGQRRVSPKPSEMTAAARFLAEVGMRSAITRPELQRRLAKQVRVLSQWVTDHAIDQGAFDDMLLRLQEAWQ